MRITINPELESKLLARALAKGISVEAYLERVIESDELAEEEIEELALEGLNSGEPISPGAAYWEEKHRHLDERLNIEGW
jgi:hypothetical protein